MNSKIQKWGNSLAIRIPKGLAEQIAVREDSLVSVHVEQGSLIVQPLPSTVPSLQQLLDRVTLENRHDEIDWGTPVGRETW